MLLRAALTLNAATMAQATGIAKSVTLDIFPGAVSVMLGFYFAARICIVLVCARLLGAEPRVGAEFSIALGLALFGFISFCSYGQSTRSITITLRMPAVRWVLVFLGLALCSLVWSATVSLPTSFVYWLGMATDVASVVLLLNNDSASEIAARLIKGFLWGACSLAALAWIMPVQRDLRLGDEDFFNTNQIGNLCAFAIFLAQYLMRRKAGNWTPAVFFLSLTLLRSLSKTTIVAFLIAEGFLVLQDRAMSRKKKMLLMCAVVVVVLLFWGLFEAYYDIYTNAGNQAETLTGRTAIWLYCLAGVAEHPWIGHGFDSMWKVVPPFGSDQFEARHAENELLQQVYSYGALGVVALAGAYGSFYRRIRRLGNASERIVLTSLLLFIVIRGLAEAEPFDLLLPLWAIVLLSVVAGNPVTQPTTERSHAVA